MAIFKKRARTDEQEEQQPPVSDYRGQWRMRPNYVPPLVILLIGLACIFFFEFGLFSFCFGQSEGSHESGIKTHQ